MRYWVYINDKVDGPFEEGKLVTLQGFTPDTLICSEDVAAGSNQEWVKASTIFEFDQVTPEPASVNQTANALPASAGNDLAALLLAKLDALTNQISGMQAKIDGMQTKLETAITEAQQARQQAAIASGEPAYEPPQEESHNTITLTRQDLDAVTEEALITNTESLVSKAEDIVAAANQEEKPLDMLGETVDLGEKKEDSGMTDFDLGSKAEEAVVLRSALDSLYNAKIQSQEEKESTFQDLLTPRQAQELAAQAAANEVRQQAETLDEALKTTEEIAPVKEETPSEEEIEKDTLISQLTAPAQEDILDQVIKEKQEEEKQDTLNWGLAGAAVAGVAAVGAAALAGNDEENSSEEPQKEEAPAVEMLALGEEVQEAPVLSIAPDASDPEKTEEVLPADKMPEDVAPVAADVPAAEAEPAMNIPSLEDADKPFVTEEEETKKEDALQELVPGATAEKPEEVIITDEDLKEAFTEREQPDQTVEQLFGIGQQPPVQQEEAAEPEAPQSLPTFEEQIADAPLPVGNPNDLTEIELKEGSTYLISDFVPPAQSSASAALPKELSGLEAAGVADHPAEEKAENPEDTSLEEMVALPAKNKQEETRDEMPGEVTVSQVILENTIKTKRGAALDIKTVPMVPEPAQSERLQLDDLADDINTQHDVKSADIKPASNTAKLVVGSLIAIVLAAIIYVMLAFLNLIPAQFNILSSNKKAVEQQAQLEEMLTDTETFAEESAPVVADQPQPVELDPKAKALADVQNFPLMNGFTLKEYIEAKHPAALHLITWEINTAVDPDNYSILVKIPPENPQSFKISYRFNYNTVTKALDPTISDAKNLLDSVSQEAVAISPAEQPQTAPEAEAPAIAQ